MAASNYSSSVPSLPPPCPMWPPEYPDLYGKRRLLLKVQMLEREIGFLEEELKTLEGLQPASRRCKEVDDFIGANPDPLIPINQKIRRPHRFWKWLCGMSCFNMSWICCSSMCPHHLGTPSCCVCHPSMNRLFCQWRCCWHLKKISCRWCCNLSALSCPECCLFSNCTCSCTKCTKVCFCPNCTKTCCSPCCQC